MIIYLAVLALVLLPALAVAVIGYFWILVPERKRSERQRAVIVLLLAQRRRRPWVEGRPSQLPTLRRAGEP